MMLLREKYNVLINVMWNCFDQSNFYISRINIIEWNNIIYVKSCCLWIEINDLCDIIMGQIMGQTTDYKISI